jgi:hypothetical protein
MWKLQVVRDGAFRRDPRLRAAIDSIMASSFIDEVGRLEWVLDRCDTLYLSLDGRGELSCFFLVAWETLSVDGQDRPALYTGLCAARQAQKGTGSIVKLFNYCMFEAQQREQCSWTKLVIWGMTATPSVLLPIRKVFANIQPADDGTYTEESARVALAIRRRLGASHAADAHPFVFPRLAAGVRYSEQERRRIAAVCRAKQFVLFERLGINEARGDRLLFVAEVPALLWRPVERCGELANPAARPDPHRTPETTGRLP